MSNLQFGVFDHLDRLEQPLADFYRDRLELVELYDQRGFHRYHVAEHHLTHLGMAPSPSVFLSSVAQRTRRLRFGPLVYLLPFYHPLRLAEEIAMLDALSNGRLDVGIGRGQTQKEIELYGGDPATAQAVFDEALEILEQAVGKGHVSHNGAHFQFPDVQMVLKCVQQPRPPLWYGVGSADSAARVAERGMNAVTNAKPALAQVIVERYFAAAASAGHNNLRIGVGRFIVVGKTDEEALSLAKRAYVKWHQAFHDIHVRFGTKPNGGFRPRDYEELIREGIALAGSPRTIAASLGVELERCRANYLVGQFYFGDMTVLEARRSVELFANEVIPALTAAVA